MRGMSMSGDNKDKMRWFWSFWDLKKNMRKNKSPGDIITILPLYTFI